jgi:ribonuclease HI
MAAGLKKIVIHTDGACEGNPGPGGWAAVLQYEQHTREISGGCPATTNNRMEMQAAIAALASLKESCDVDLFTDSQYLREGITAWIAGWKRRNWMTKEKTPVRNADLWRELDALCSRHEIHWHWLKGHAGHEWNERCDTLAVEQIAVLKKQHTREQLLQLKEVFLEQRKKQMLPAASPVPPVQSTLL